MGFDENSYDDDAIDRVTITASGVNGIVYLGGGNNVMSNAGLIESEQRLFSFDGDERLIMGVVLARDDNDLMTNTATGRILGGVDLGGGNDTLTNAGRIVDRLPEIDNEDQLFLLAMADGNDVLTNSGTIGASKPIFSGNRSISNNLFQELHNGDSDLGQAISMGDGNDVLTNTAGRVFGIIDMGAGNDVLYGGAFNELVEEGDGRDNYQLGAGADALAVRSIDTFVDTMAGGLGLDLITFSDLEGASSGQRIDLAAGRIVYEVTGRTDTVGGAGNGIDTISGFEQVYGSLENDFIFGAAAAETLHGGEGDDFIQGGGSKDLLIGNEGADSFAFTAATDSGKTRLTRDVIADFESGEDQIIFTFDSDTRLGVPSAGVQNTFDFIGMNVGFDGSAGAIRGVWAGSSTLVEVDTNGDRRVDFVVELRGQHTLIDTDFAFVFA